VPPKLTGSIPLGEVSKNFCINITQSPHPPKKITQSTNNTQCLFSPRTYFVCGTAAYICLPPGWKGICTKALLTPQNDVVPGNQSLPIPLEAYGLHSIKESYPNCPPRTALGITAGIGTGIGGISSSVCIYQKLSTEFTNDKEQVSQSTEALPDQVDSLASVVLQNRRALDLLTAEKGGTCLLLNEDVAFMLTNLGWSETWPDS
jgi:hypothetical protein